MKNSAHGEIVKRCELCVSVLNRSSDTSRGGPPAWRRAGAEGAEKRVFDYKTLRTLRTQRLCGEITIPSLVAALPR